MTCLLAHALLFPKGLLSQHCELAVVLSKFFELSWGPLDRILFLIVVAAFLSDTCLAAVDAVSRIYADCIHAFSRRARLISVHFWYLFFVLLLPVVTSIIALLDQPGPLMLFSAVIGLVGIGLFSIALVFLNLIVLPRHFLDEAKPGRLSLSSFSLAWPTGPGVSLSESSSSRLLSRSLPHW